MTFSTFGFHEKNSEKLNLLKVQSGLGRRVGAGRKSGRYRLQILDIVFNFEEMVPASSFQKVVSHGRTTWGQKTGGAGRKS